MVEYHGLSSRRSIQRQSCTMEGVQNDFVARSPLLLQAVELNAWHRERRQNGLCRDGPIAVPLVSWTPSPDDPHLERPGVSERIPPSPNLLVVRVQIRHLGWNGLQRGFRRCEQGPSAEVADPTMAKELRGTMKPESYPRYNPALVPAHIDQRNAPHGDEV